MKIRFIIVLWAVSMWVTAQDISVSATLQPAQIQIGEQAVLRLTVAQPQDKQVVCPLLSDTITRGVEIVTLPTADTTQLGNGRIEVKQDYLITSFDSGFYFIPSYAYACEQDTLLTAPLGLSVTTVPVDAQNDDIKTIKPIMSAPFLWSELFTWVGYALLVLALIAIVVLLLLKYVFKKRVPLISKEPEPVIPPHIVALNRLEAIKAEKAWQSGNIKAFYTDVTDVLRVYLEGRFAINAMELTSDEIMALVKKEPALEVVRTKLRQLLELSDLVKFAKMVPLENENESSLLVAFEVVDTTKPQEETEEDDSQILKATTADAVTK